MDQLTRRRNRSRAAPAEQIGSIVAVIEYCSWVISTLKAQTDGSCPAFDPNGNQVVSINELIAGVNAALRGCGTRSTPARCSPWRPSASKGDYLRRQERRIPPAHSFAIDRPDYGQLFPASASGEQANTLPSTPPSRSQILAVECTPASMHKAQSCTREKPLSVET